MRVLLTGGGGFLGAAIISRFLDDGVEVRAIGRTDKTNDLIASIGNKARLIEWRLGDVAATEDMASAALGCDTIVHLAGVLTPFCKNDPIAGAMTNVIGTLNVFEAAKQNGIGKVIYCSSGGVFGTDDENYPFPLTHYGAFKLANEGSARAYWLDNRIASIGFRPFVVYGPGRERGLSAGPTLACKAAALGETYTIPITGKVGLVYIDDIAAAFTTAALTAFQGAHVFNLPGTPASILDVIEKIGCIVPGARISCTGEPLPMVATTRNDYFNDLLVLPPPVDLDAGLERTIEHYRKKA
jgi:nucleoside-diphosphate-sugar epimerase